MKLEATQLTDSELALGEEVSAWLAQRLPPGSYRPGLGMGGDTDRQFSRDLGSQGWLGMTLPVEYGGGGRSAVDRFIVVEELLAVGAPVGFHWVSDRQSGPNIAKNGTEEQKRYFLPRIARGELSFAIGMSEPDAGSDLAGLRTRAVRSGDAWRVNGTKIWTSGAAEADYILALLRTSDDRRGGLTQFLVDRNSEGLTVSPIDFIDGTRDFCELSFDDVLIPDSRRLGEVGGGWSQNTAELVLERGGVDRWMSLIPVLERWAKTEWGAVPGWFEADLGHITARCWAFRSMSLSLARMVDAGLTPIVEAALIKEMATRFEQECVEIVRRHFGRLPALGSEDQYESLLARAILTSPSWSIRGGTNEVLRNIVGRELMKP
ncbi:MULTISPECIES: acyl-CoA dehydrogenase family protein [unclassified Pseudofrankia]|uniref:acyl-CoA dehydrogenase family protein n=1 Tax=unclassified Pseudofrankia TaxID=2994372 RepID=UPI0008D9447C|nr:MULTISPECIES: acyl-CoA dehydrogenase family protein [unclassified Pseudofrankia]MDT3446319.1 acyl-CoA dehydrogenase family protein [Pseudofrankia sp. BMG5.37]OHV57228.1 acyl-CoA dehydrogenase [Pseudofrankia sp. BMG5.36]